MVSIELPKEYGYVLGVTAFSYLVSAWLGIRVSSYRRAAGVSYPNAYASQESISNAAADKKQALYLFNCAQRGHGNFLENYPTALAGWLVAGVRYPVASAALGAVWCVSRISYAIGYTAKDKSDGRGRYRGSVGAWFWFAQLGLLGLTAKTGLDLITA